VIPLSTQARVPVFPFVTYALVVANVVVFFQEFSAPDVDTFINAFAAIPYDITHNVVLAPPSPPIPAATLFTSMFLHASILHIVFNMLFLIVFGPEIEYACGHLSYLAFYLLCGLIGGATQVLIDPSSHVPAIGASGAIAGVLGAYIVTYPSGSVQTVIPIGCLPLFFRLPAVLVIGLWAAVQFMHGWGAITTRALSEQGGGTAYFAHIGGFASGVILMPFFRRRKTVRSYRYYR
jgi:membrane associated rhomboid family serine protease